MKKEYSKPELIEYENLQDVTEGLALSNHG